MQIRIGTHDDIAPVALLHASVIAELSIPALSMGFNAPGKPTLDEAMALFKERIEEEEGLLLIAVGTSGLLGYLTAVVEDYPDDLLDTPYMTIEFVVTAPAARKQGIAAALISRAETIAMERGITNTDILVWASNANARKLYEKLGYSILEHRMAKKLPET